jgi:N-acetylmuramoyl-L-alanine amidase
MKFTVKFYTGNYITRQRAANADGCICYGEHHFNACDVPTANYPTVIVANNASRKSKDWAWDYHVRICAEFNAIVGRASTPVRVGGYGGRGNANLVHTAMPAILVEPLFASNPTHAKVIRSPEGQARLAKCLADSIRAAFPKGGLVAFSVGHKGKRNNPRDRGCAVHGAKLKEADYAEMVLAKAKELLEAE